MRAPSINPPITNPLPVLPLHKAEMTAASSLSESDEAAFLVTELIAVSVNAGMACLCLWMAFWSEL